MKVDMLITILIILCFHIFLWPILSVLLSCKAQNLPWNGWHQVQFREIPIYMVISYPIIVGLLLGLFRLSGTI